jgi:hypothetical protein
MSIDAVQYQSGRMAGKPGLTGRANDRIADA